MIARTAGSGWQYALADLSLILFMVTAAALAQTQTEENALPVPLAARGEPLAVWRVGPDAPLLPDWLAAQPPDPRQQLTIVAQYRTGRQGDALDEVRVLAVSAADAGIAARIIIEPGEGGVTATLAHDLPAEALARRLPDAAAIPSHWSRP